MSTHAVFSPSGAKKWMTCSGSIAMEADEPGECNEYTDEGTAAHELGRMCLVEGKHPSAYLGRVLHVVNGVYWPDDHTPLPPKLKGHQTDIKRQFTVDIDMVAGVNAYVQSVHEYTASGDLMVEERVPIGHITGEKDAEGTADAVIYLPADNALSDELQVHDLKFGRGVKVFAANNPQGMLYLLGALQKFEPVFGTPKRYRFVIHQPRIDHLDEWDCTHDELMAFAAKAKAEADTARLALTMRADWMGKSTVYLTPGEHCHKSFCKARAKCPALAVFVSKSVGADFEVLALTQPTDGSFKALIPTDLRALGEKAAVIDIITDWCKQVRAKVEATLFDNHNSTEAQTSLGFKLVEGKKGNRQWEDVEKAETALKAMRLKSEQIYDFSVKSPPAMEKVLADQPKRWAKLQPLVTQKKGQPSVTELSDKRPALVVKPVADDFAVEGSDLA